MGNKIIILSLMRPRNLQSSIKKVFKRLNLLHGSCQEEIKYSADVRLGFDELALKIEPVMHYKEQEEEEETRRETGIETLIYDEGRGTKKSRGITNLKEYTQ